MRKTPTNREIADVLREMSVCYEMDGIAFKPAAYERAADAIDNLSEEAAEIYRRGGVKALDEIEGVGAAIAKHIESLLKRGDFPEHRACMKRMPEETLALVSVPDLGPKKVKALHEKLKVETLDDLARVARKGLVRTLPGFGARTEEKILKGIAMLKGAGDRRLLGHILPLTRELERKLKEVPGVRHAVTAGSVRRRQETIGDLDMLVTTSRPKIAMDAFAALPEVKEVLERGRTMLVVALRNGMQCDVRVVEDEVFGAALQHFTGSKEHNVVLRKLAASRGLKLNEYGLWRNERRLAARTEEDIYARLGLPFIEPEIRTDTGEIDAALADRLPDLLPYGSVRGDMQVQSDWTDGAASIEKMAEAAFAAGLEYLAMTDHTKSLAMTGGLDERGLAKQGKEIERVNATLAAQDKKFVVLKGAEVNIMKDGRLDIRDSALEQLDFAGAAVHSLFRLPRREQTERIVRAMRNPHVDVILHPTGRLIHRRDPMDLDFERVLRVAKETRTALEINAHPDRTDLSDAHVRLAVKMKVRLVVSTDAHDPSHLRYLELGEATARRGWASKRDVINTKTATDMKKWLTLPKNKRV